MRDVGLDATAEQRRSVKIQRKRERKCCKRGVHIKISQNGPKHKHETKRLFKTGIFTALVYGYAGMGACPSSLPHKRTMAADSCGERTKTACTTIILHFHLGETGDPANWFSLDQIRTCFELQSEDLEHRLNRVDVARARAAAAGNMRKYSRWSMVNCNNGDFARYQHYSCAKTWTLTGLPQVQTQALSFER